CSVRLSPSAPTAIYTLSLHDALPILDPGQVARAHPALPPLHQVVGSDHPGVPQPQELLLALDGELLSAARLLDLQLHAAVRLGTVRRCCNPSTTRRGANQFTRATWPIVVKASRWIRTAPQHLTLRVLQTAEFAIHRVPAERLHCKPG